MINVIGILLTLWSFFWAHDQFFAILFVGWWWIKNIKRPEYATVAKTDVYRKALELFTGWKVDRHLLSVEFGDLAKDTARKNDLAQKNLDNEIAVHKIFDQLTILGSSTVKKWIKNARKSSVVTRPWITDENIEEFIYLISSDMGTVSFAEKVRHWLNK